MVALTDEQLREAGNIPKQEAHNYANARGLVQLAESLDETNTEASELIKKIEEEYPNLLAVYELALAALREERDRLLRSSEDTS